VKRLARKDADAEARAKSGAHYSNVALRCITREIIVFFDLLIAEFLESCCPGGDPPREALSSPLATTGDS